MIKESWNEQKAVRDIMIFLQTMESVPPPGPHLPPVRQQRRRPDQRKTPIASAPTSGNRFKTADGVAISLGIPPQSEIRARAGLIYVLQTFTEEGHCFCAEPELLLQAQALLDIPVEILSEALKHEVETGRLVRDEHRIYLVHLYQAELNIAEKSARSSKRPPPSNPSWRTTPCHGPKTECGSRFRPCRPKRSKWR